MAVHSYNKYTNLLTMQRIAFGARRPHLCRPYNISLGQRISFAILSVLRILCVAVVVPCPSQHPCFCFILSLIFVSVNCAGNAVESFREETCTQNAAGQARTVLGRRWIMVNGFAGAALLELPDADCHELLYFESFQKRMSSFIP